MNFMTFAFPPLRAGVLTALVDLKERVDEDPNFLDGSDYDNEAKRVLGLLFAPKIVEKVVEKIVEKEPARGRGRPTKDVALSDEDMTKVRENVKKLIEQLDTMGEGEDQKGLEINEKIQIIKTKANLNEQLIKMQERVFNVKRLSDFQTIVLGIVESLVPDSDRHLFLERIEQYRD